MKKQIILIVAITSLTARSFGQKNFMEQYVSPEVLTSVTNFDSLASNVSQLEGNRNSFQFYVQFEDGPLVWFTTQYDNTMENVFYQFLVNSKFVSTPYYYKYTGGYSNKITLPLDSKYKMDKCIIDWGKITDAGFMNNQSHLVSLLQYNKVNNNSLTSKELITRN